VWKKMKLCGRIVGLILALVMCGSVSAVTVTVHSSNGKLIVNGQSVGNHFSLDTVAGFGPGANVGGVSVTESELAEIQHINQQINLNMNCGGLPGAILAIITQRVKAGGDADQIIADVQAGMTPTPIPNFVNDPRSLDDKVSYSADGIAEKWGATLTSADYTKIRGMVADGFSPDAIIAKWDKINGF
jgi:hypothetical protein